MTDISTPNVRLEIAVNKVDFSNFNDTHIYEEVKIAGFTKAYLSVSNMTLAPVELYGKACSNFYQFLLTDSIIKPGDTVIVIIIIRQLLLVVCDTFDTATEFDIYSEKSRQAYNDMINFYYSQIDRRLSKCILYKHEKATDAGIRALLSVKSLYLVNNIRSAISLDEMEYDVVSLPLYGLILEINKQHKSTNDTIFDTRLYYIMKQLYLYNKKAIFDETSSMIKVYIEGELDLEAMLSSAISLLSVGYKAVQATSPLYGADTISNLEAAQFAADNELTKIATIITVYCEDTSSFIKLSIDACSGHIMSNIKSSVEPDASASMYSKYAADVRADVLGQDMTTRLDYNPVTYTLNEPITYIKDPANFSAILTLPPRELSNYITNVAAECLGESAGADSGQNQPAADSGQPTQDIVVTVRTDRDDKEPPIVTAQCLHDRLTDFDEYNTSIIYPEYLAFVLTSMIDDLDVAITITENAPADPVFLVECFKKHYLLKSSYNNSVTKMLLVINIIISIPQSAPVVQFTVLHAATQNCAVYFSKDYINSIMRSILFDITFRKTIYMFNSKSKSHHLPKFVVNRTIKLFLDRCTIILDYARNFDKEHEFYIKNLATELRFNYVDYYLPPVLGVAPGVNRYSAHVYKHYQLVLEGLRSTIEIYISTKSVNHEVTFCRINGIAINYDVIQLHLLDKIACHVENPIIEDEVRNYVSSDIINELADYIDIPDKDKHKKDIAELIKGPSDCEFTRIDYTTLLSIISMRHISLNSKKSEVSSVAKNIWDKMTDVEKHSEAGISPIERMTKSLTNKLTELIGASDNMKNLLINRPEEVYTIASNCGVWQDLTLEEFKEVVQTTLNQVSDKK